MSERANDRATDTTSDLESHTSNAPVATNEPSPFDSQVRITFHHTRARLADIDGLSGKAAIDGIVKAGILADDSPKQVAEVSHTQSKGSVEKTIITIESNN